MIPKVLYLYWGGQPLSWLRYLTAKSFNKHNPDWQIKVYYPTEPTDHVSWESEENPLEYKGKDYFQHLEEIAELLPFDMKKVGMDNRASEVHKSDVFRLWVLHQFGGVYSDFDIIYTKPIPVFDERVYYHDKEDYYAVGFLAAKKNDPLYKELLNTAPLITANKYQVFGATMWGNKLTEEPEGINLPKNFIYSYDWTDVKGLFTKNKKLPKDAVGVHWYGGSAIAREWENDLTPENVHEYDTTITNLIKELA